jgi:YfiH family protein
VIGLHDSAGGAHFAFTDRWGGVSAAPRDTLNLGGAVGDDPSAVVRNRELAAGALGLDPAQVVWMNQVHGREVAVVDGPWGGEAPSVDAVVTTRRGLALAVLTADCTPVLMADPVAGVAGAAHAGRPGLVAGVVGAAVEAMVRLGADPARVEARIGPAVCGRCYEVPETMRAEVAAVVPQAHATTSWGPPSVDVPAGVRAQLAAHGVPAPAGSGVCTLESEDHFSYRREKRTGRLAGYVWLEPAAAGAVADGTSGA